jgi:hypothetical protein
MMLSRQVRPSPYIQLELFMGYRSNMRASNIRQHIKFHRCIIPDLEGFGWVITKRDGISSITTYKDAIVARNNGGGIIPMRLYKILGVRGLILSCDFYKVENGNELLIVIKGLLLDLPFMQTEAHAFVCQFFLLQAPR